ncbi:hypothetical protein ACTXIU_15840 [Glutamicibacter arilaitensis]|uniref:hypothetical protein n=1 Tax=Glutamicibacter arilaitensis TaxID=256701 RepID=UPI003F934C7F
MLAAAARRVLRGGPLPAGSLPAPPEARGNRRVQRWTAGLSGAALLAMLGAGLPRDPYAINYLRLQAPSLDLPFGADSSGRDLLARVAHGTLGTILPASLIVLCAVLIGLLLAAAGDISRGPSMIANATPPILAGVIIAALAGPSVGGAAVAVLWVTWPPLATHAASLLEEARAMPHIRWLPLAGLGREQIWFRHLCLRCLRPCCAMGCCACPVLRWPWLRWVSSGSAPSRQPRSGACCLLKASATWSVRHGRPCHQPCAWCSSRSAR